MATVRKTAETAEPKKEDGAQPQQAEAKPATTTLEELEKLIADSRKAQKEYAEFPQEKVDAIFKAAALAADKEAFDLAKEAVEETGMGNFEDKVIKNHYASQFIYSQYKDTKTCGIIEKDEAKGVMKIAEPLGVLAGVVPCTNPTSTAIFKCLLALKTRNGLVFSPHPRAKACTAHAIKIVMEAAAKAGCPENLIACIPNPSVETSAALMKLCDTTLATGGPGMVASAYSSGKPALGVGPGNVSVIVDSSADYRLAASCIIHSKGFDNGVICASEQNCVFAGNDEQYEEFKKALQSQGAFFVQAADMDKFRNVLMRHNPKNPEIMSASPAITGRTPHAIGELAGVEVPVDCRLLVGEITNYETSEAWAHEKLSPTLSLIHAHSYQEALNIAEHIVEHGGHGHTAALHIDPVQTNKIDQFALTLETCRLVVNMPSSQGAIGGIYSDGIRSSLTLGCGSWGNNSTWENIGVNNLLNIKTLVIPVKPAETPYPTNVIYGKDALKSGLKAFNASAPVGRIVVVHDSGLRKQAESFIGKLDKSRRNGVSYFEATAQNKAVASKLAEQIRLKKAKTVIAFGGDKASCLAKAANILLASPRADFAELAMPVLSSAKRIVQIPSAGLYLVTVPTSAWASYAYNKSLCLEDKGHKRYVTDLSLAPALAIACKDFIKKEKSNVYEEAYMATARLVSSYCSMLAGKENYAWAVKGLRDAMKIFEKKPSLNREIELGILSATAVAKANGGLVDALSEALEETFKVSIEGAYSVLLPVCLSQVTNDCPYKLGTGPSYFAPQGAERIAKLSSKLGYKGTAEERVQEFSNWLANVRVERHLPTVLADLGITPASLNENVDKAVELAFAKQAVLTAPVYSRVKKIKELLLSLL